MVSAKPREDLMFSAKYSSVWAGAALLVALAPLSAQTQPTDATRFIDEMNQAYAGLKDLQNSGSVKVDIDIAGQKQNDEMAFVSSFAAPASYRHELKNAMLVGSDGRHAYAFDERALTYIQNDAPEKRVPTRQLAFPAAQVLQMQNPSLLFAISDSALSDLLEGASQQVVQRGQKQGDRSIDTLSFTASDGRRVVLSADAASHLLSQMEVDMSDVFVKRGAPDVKSAKVTISYTQLQTGAKAEPGQFAWTPPSGARERHVTPAGEPLSPIEGKAAPEFKLADLSGKELKLSDVKNKVVVLDFWATWCAPCVEALPQLDKFYAARKDKLAVFAINAREGKPEVATFVKDQKLSVPVVIDADGKVEEAYGVEGYPTTVIIGRDGKVRKVFAGVPIEGEEVILRAIDAVLAEK